MFIYPSCPFIRSYLTLPTECLDNQGFGLLLYVHIGLKATTNRFSFPNAPLEIPSVSRLVFDFLFAFCAFALFVHSLWTIF